MPKRNARINRRRLLIAAAGLLAAPAILRSPAAAQTLQTIRSRNKIIVGIQGDNPPWGFVTTAGVQDGFDADISRLLGERMGVPVEFVALAVANRIPALVSGRVDVLFATMAMLPERARAVQFSKPYVANEIQLVAAKTTEIRSDADMGRVTIGVPRSSTQDTQVTNRAPSGTRILRFDDDAATIQALLSGQVQAVGANAFYIQRLDQARPGVFERKLTFMSLYNGACSRLGERDINAELNAFIDAIKANGALRTAYRKWMSTDPPEFPESLPDIPFTVR
jgi:polar amino acid transport system substrate-binding protein